MSLTLFIPLAYFFLCTVKVLGNMYCTCMYAWCSFMLLCTLYNTPFMVRYNYVSCMYRYTYIHTCTCMVLHVHTGRLVLLISEPAISTPVHVHLHALCTCMYVQCFMHLAQHHPHGQLFCFGISAHWVTTTSGGAGVHNMFVLMKVIIHSSLALPLS